MASRIPAIDALKALAIVTVVWIHTFPTNVAPQPLVHDLHFLARFAVPSLFFASGMLTGRSGRRPWRHFCFQRLPRILGPYVIASLLALWYRDAVLNVPVGLRDGAVRLLGGDAFGPYYFVPVLVGGAVALEALQRVPRLLPVAAIVFVAASLACDTLVLALEWRTADPFYWMLRNPLRWWGYLFAGAWVGSRWDTIAAMRPAWGGGALLLAGTLWTSWAWGGLLWIHEMIAQWVGIWSMILGIILVLARVPAWAPLRVLSDLSYPIYLYHLFVVSQAWIVLPRTPWRSLGVWLLAVLLPLGGGLVARRVLGRRRARFVVG